MLRRRYGCAVKNGFPLAADEVAADLKIGMGWRGVSVYFWHCISEIADGISIKFGIRDRQYI